MTAGSHAVVVVQPLTVDDPAGLKALLAERFRIHSREAPVWTETTPSDPGTEVTLAALRDGADLVLCCGGDGTVRAVASALACTGVPLALLPTGTGNLLARNLDIPQNVTAAVEVALTGRHRRLDMGTAGDRHFVVMAGIGLDAAMVRDAPPGLKKRVGWAAYVVFGLRHLLDPPMQVQLRLDGGPWLDRSARTVVVGNVGRLQGGMQLLPEADPTDGVLDVAVLGPRGLQDWVRVAGRVLLGTRREDYRLERRQFRRLELRVRDPQPHEVDGDPAGDVTALIVEVQPGALTVTVPA